MLIGNILEQVAGEIELAAGEVQLALMRAGEKPTERAEPTDKFNPNILFDEHKDEVMGRFWDELCKEYDCENPASDDALTFIDNYMAGLIAVAYVVGLIKGLCPSDIKYNGDEPDCNVNAEVALLNYIGTSERFTDPVYDKAEPAPMIEYMDPFNDHEVYFDDEMIEYAFEVIKAKDPAKECRVKSDIKAGKATIEYLFADARTTQEVAAAHEPDDVEIVYVNQGNADSADNNAQAESRRKSWKEMRAKLQEDAGAEEK